ncbi:MAG: DUF3576 domain-containing protein [Micavibrio sp.]
MFAITKTLLPLLTLILLAACSSVPQGEAKYPTGADRNTVSGGQNDIYAEQESVFGSGGLLSLGKGDKAEDGQTGLGVNSYLWRAALDTVSFMPLASADPFGGVILTDWYTPEATPNERLKLNVFILDRQLRANALQVKVFRQTRKSSGASWKDASVAPETGRQLEDSILTRARQLRVADLGEGS